MLLLCAGPNQRVGSRTRSEDRISAPWAQLTASNGTAAVPPHGPLGGTEDGRQRLLDKQDRELR
jgi:hypothetical protein